MLTDQLERSVVESSAAQGMPKFQRRFPLPTRPRIVPQTGKGGVLPWQRTGRTSQVCHFKEVLTLFPNELLSTSVRAAPTVAKA
jgi:hypothetical protein